MLRRPVHRIAQSPAHLEIEQSQLQNHQGLPASRNETVSCAGTIPRWISCSSPCLRSPVSMTTDQFGCQNRKAACLVRFCGIQLSRCGQDTLALKRLLPQSSQPEYKLKVGLWRMDAQPAVALATSSCALGAWSMLSLPERVTRRSSPEICATSRSFCGSMMRPELSSGSRSRNKSDLGCLHTSYMIPCLRNSSRGNSPA